MPKTETAVVSSDEAVEKVRPLSTSQAAALKKLISNDYANLHDDLRAFHDEELKRRLEAVDQQFADLGVDEKAITRKVKAAAKKFQDAMDAIRAEVEDYDMQVRLPYLMGGGGYRYGEHENDIVMNPRGREQARVNVQNEMAKVYHDAQRALHRAESAAERQVLVAQVTGTAEQILAGIPSPQELFAQAQQQITAQAIES